MTDETPAARQARIDAATPVRQAFDADSVTYGIRAAALLADIDPAGLEPRDRLLYALALVGASLAIRGIDVDGEIGVSGSVDTSGG